MSEKQNFQWFNKDYEVELPSGLRMTDEFITVLPNRTVLRINGAISHTKREIFHPLQHASLGEIAQYFNAVLAQEVI